MDSPSTPDTLRLEILKKTENRVFSVQELAAQFDSPRSMPKDPTEMTILERKALFERNKGPVSNTKLQTPKTNNLTSQSRSPAASLNVKKEIKCGLEMSKAPTSPGASSGIKLIFALLKY